MKHHFGFLVDLAGLQFSDDTVSWIQAFPIGTWNHPVYGKIEMTSERVEKLAANVVANVRGQDLNIDYDHQTGEAAGWVKQAEARPDGLWLAVEWTKEAAEKIKNKVYRYFSPEYADEWEDPRTKTTHKDVLFGGGITNRPFLKGILPLNLSEAFAETNGNVETGDDVDPKLIRKALKLSEDATDEQVTAALVKLSEPPQDDDKKIDDKVDDKKLDETKVDPEALKLAESDPLVKGLVDRIAILEGATRLSEIDLLANKLSESKDAVLSPATIEAAKALALKAPRAFGDELFKLLGEVKVVSLKEVGRTTTEGDSDKTATQEFSEKAKKLAESDKISLSDAMSRVAADEPELFEQYRNESYVRQNV